MLQKAIRMFVTRPIERRIGFGLETDRLVYSPIHFIRTTPKSPLARRIEGQRRRLSFDRSSLTKGCEAGPFDEGISVGQANWASREPNGCHSLYAMANHFSPATTLELGTNLGISSAYLASAGGRVVTMDASQCRLAQARRVHANLGLSNIEYVSGYFTDTLAKTLASLPPIDLAFIDGHHQYQPTLDYFAMIKKHGHADTVYLFDDIHWSEGMEQAWLELRSGFEWFGEMFGIGIGLKAR